MGEIGLHMEYRDIFRSMKKRLWILFVIMAVVMTVSIFYRTYMAKPVYEGKVSLIIGNVLDSSKSQFHIDDVNNTNVYMQTYVMILKTNKVAERTISSLGLDIDVSKFKRHYQAEPQPNTQFMEISLKWGNREEAQVILDTIINVFIEEAIRIYPTYTIKELEKIKPYRVEAVSDSMYYILCFLGSFLIAVFIVLMMEAFDTTLKTEDDIEKYLKLSVIGTIPKLKRKQLNAVKSNKGEEYDFLDAYRTLRTNLLYISNKFDIKTIIITSARPREGKSTAASMLAIVLAQGGKKTLLMDCDLRSPAIDGIFGLRRFGLTNILLGECNWMDAVQETGTENLSIISAGYKALNPVELLSSEAMKQLMSDLGQVFEYIILDTPPVGLVTEAQVLSQFADGYLMIVSSGESEKEITVKAQRLIQYAEGKILGALLNKVQVPKSYYRYRKYKISETQ